MENIRPFPSIRSFQKSIHAFFRVLLGMLLLARGISFIFNLTKLQQMIESTFYSTGAETSAYLIAVVHLFGGSLIVIGLLFRIAILLQIPILVFAFVFNTGQNLPANTLEFWLSLFVFVGLIYFLIKGAGQLSMDEYRRHYQI